jgi:hypothetical protein
MEVGLIRPSITIERYGTLDSTSKVVTPTQETPDYRPQNKETQAQQVERVDESSLQQFAQLGDLLTSTTPNGSTQRIAQIVHYLSSLGVDPVYMRHLGKDGGKPAEGAEVKHVSLTV